MPIYRYKCELKHITEIFQGINSKPLEVCPQCGKKVVKIPAKFNTEKSRIQS